MNMRSSGIAYSCMFFVFVFFFKYFTNYSEISDHSKPCRKTQSIAFWGAKHCMHQSSSVNAFKTKCLGCSVIFSRCGSCQCEYSTKAFCCVTGIFDRICAVQFLLDIKPPLYSSFAQRHNFNKTFTHSSSTETN